MGDQYSLIEALNERIAVLEKELADSMRQWRNVTKRTEDFAAQTDCWFWETDANHFYNYLSDNLEAVSVGLRRTDFLGKNRLELINASDSADKAQHIDGLLFQKPFRNFRYSLRCHNGESRHIVSSGWPIKNKSGAFMGYRGTARDETAEVVERHTQQEKERGYLAAIEEANLALEERVEERTRELRDLQAKLIKEERDATMNKLIAKISHELRNPLNALNTSLYIIRSKVGDDPRLTKAFDRSERTIKRCERILSDLYDYVMTTELETDEIDVGTWSDAQTRQLIVPDGVDFTYSNTALGTVCDVDDRVLTKAIFKILKNALHAVTTDAPDQDKRLITFTIAPAGDNVEFVVEDNGPGMSADVAERSCEPLFSTRGFGVGLGLPFAEQSFRQHGGGLKLETKEGRGTKVTLWLPQSKAGKGAHAQIDDRVA